MKRKILFLIFAGDDCRLKHAFHYALEAAKAGQDIQILIEGAATRATRKLYEEEESFRPLLTAAVEKSLIAGACAAACKGCSDAGAGDDISPWMAEKKISLISKLDGHTSLASFLARGYEVITF